MDEYRLPAPELRHHHWEAGEKAEYDSLSANGRNSYDMLRWWKSAGHKTAFDSALAEHGHNKVFSMKQAGEWPY